MLSHLFALLQANPISLEDATRAAEGLTTEGLLLWIVMGLLAITGLVIVVLWKELKAVREKETTRADSNAAALTTLAGALDRLSQKGGD